eukprot:TRINITY_DN5033_c0_g1_i1.p1 TRINITY_DN5033_c0_g1~~TRINITY_DN5033_c0_g1_i1.p1  ORF type:complete len:207 (-),score=27.15 TRINITY_DN5033_c0_g1_i1:585-1205(-)
MSTAWPSGPVPPLPGVVIEHACTKEITTTYLWLGKVVSCTNICSACCHFVLSSVLLWYSNMVPVRCNRPFERIFIGLGICNAILGVASALMTIVGRELIDILSNRRLAQKFEAEGRRLEAAACDHREVLEVSTAYKFAACPLCFYVLAQVAIVAVWTRGVYDTMGSNAWCWGAQNVFYWLLFIQALLWCLTLGEWASSIYTYRRFY